MKLHSGASVSCLRSYCQPFRTEPGMLGAPLALPYSPHFFYCFPSLITCLFDPLLLSFLGCGPCPSSPLSLSISLLPPSSVSLFMPFSQVYLPSSPLFATSHSLVVLSYKGLTADSDSKSTQWTNDTNTWGHHFIYSAQKAKLSVRP